MSIESDAKKWIDNVSRIRELDPQGVLLSKAGGYFDAVAAVFENKDFNPEDTKKKLGALRGRLSRLTGTPVAVELGSFIIITERYATKTQADFDGFVRALYSPGASPRPSPAGSSPRPAPRPSPTASSPRPSPRPSPAGSSPRPAPRPSPSGSSPRPSPVESSWLDAFASTGNTSRPEPRNHTAGNPFAEDEKEDHSTALRVIGVIILLLLVIFLIYTSTGSGKSAILSRYAVESVGVENNSGVENSNRAVENGNGVVKGTVKDSRDGKIYRTVRIGSQIWMAENLNYDYNVEFARSYCYNDDPKNCAKYGRLYTWYAAMDACPEGWYLPSNVEWDALKKFVANSLFGGKTDAVGVGYVLKSTGGWGNGNGSDAFGFGALPGGDRSSGGTFFGILGYARFWSASEKGADNAYLQSLSNNRLVMSYDRKSVAHSVRCVKDD